MVNVVTVVPGRNISEKTWQKIRDVSPEVDVQDASAWVIEEQTREFVPPERIGRYAK